MRLFTGDSPPGNSSALELSMLGLVRVMSSLLAVNKQVCEAPPLKSIPFAKRKAPWEKRGNEVPMMTAAIFSFPDGKTDATMGLKGKTAFKKLLVKSSYTSNST